MFGREINGFLCFITALIFSLTCLVGLIIVCVEIIYYANTHLVPPTVLAASIGMQIVSVFVSCFAMIYFLYMYFKYLK